MKTLVFFLRTWKENAQRSKSRDELSESLKVIERCQIMDGIVPPDELMDPLRRRSFGRTANEARLFQSSKPGP